MDLRQALDVVTQQLAREGLMAKAWLIGSLATGTFGPGSDVDIVVGGSQPSDYGTLWNRFSDALGMEVDLLRFEELPESFRDRVSSEGLALRVS